MYVNLKEWATKTAWIPDEHPPTDAELSSFVENNIIDRGDQYVEDFLRSDVDGRSMFKYLLEHGRFFFILDSFDEIPQLLNQAAHSKWLVEELSKVVYRLLSGGYTSRGVLASRRFRQPSDAFDSETVLELRPFSDFQILSCLRRSGSYNEGTLKELFATRTDLIPVLRNPFATGLLAAYRPRDAKTLPGAQGELYDDYLRRRLDDDKEIVERVCEGRRSPLQTKEILECAKKIAIVLVEHLETLEAPLDDVAQAVANHFDGSRDDVLMTADILTFTKIARQGGRSAARRFSFAHRRFAEYFVAKSLGNDTDQLDLESIPEDRPMREALALYCGEVANDDTAVHIANYCWERIRPLDPVNGRPTEAGYRDAIHCLRFLSTAFRGRVLALTAFQAQLGDLIVTTVAGAGNMLTVKLVVEATGVLGEADLDRAVTSSLRLRNFWISETALRACRHLAEPSPKLVNRLKIYFGGIPPLEFFQRRSELLFSLSLSEGFGKLRQMCKFRLIDTYCAAAGLGLAVIGDVFGVMWTVVTVLVMAGLHMVGEVGQAAGSDGTREVAYKRRRELAVRRRQCRRWLGSVPRCGEKRWVLGWRDLFPEFVDARNRLGTWLVLGRVMYVGMTGVLLLSTGDVMSRGILGGEVGRVWLACAAALLLTPYYYVWLLWPWLRMYWPAVVGGLGVYLGLAGVYVATMAWLEDVFAGRLGNTADAMLGVLRVLVVGAFCLVMVWGLVGGLRRWYNDRKRLKGLKVRTVWTRQQIAEELEGLLTAGARAALVGRLEERRVVPSGSWPGGELPNFGEDVASIRLAQLEERWLGFGRQG